MSDLISRKALSKAMEEKYKIAEATGLYPTGLSEAFIIIDKIIREQPTAYDVDKVVEQLEQCKYAYPLGTWCDMVEEAIEIVKCGGVDE